MPGSGFSNGNPYAPLPIYTPDPSLFPFDPSQVAYSPSTYLDEGRFAPNTSQDNSTPDGASGFPSPTATTRLSGRSPRLIDLLLPGSDLNARPGSLPGYQEPQSISAYRPLSEPSNEVYQNGPGEDDEIEEVIREPDSMPQGWVTCLPSPAPSHVSLVSNDSQGGVIKSMYRQVDFPASSPEMLMLRFDQQTCGILSIKDGPTENPWRTMMWPMAVDAPALYHAVAAMTAFHTSRERPSLRMAGVEHMRQSIHLLATGIESMRTDTALATTLALAFSESWDQHILSGIRHLRGARILVNQALVKHNKFSSSRHEFARLRFLINAWVYMDVLSQLTSLDDADTINFDHVMPFLYGPFGANTELDPLMGSAGTLFPLIGKAANLVRRVRKSKSNSPAIISQALDLKLQIETWNSGRSFETPEDPSSEIEHSVHTAEAYRWATLLYLHQAVPEMPSMTTAQLAKRVLVYLARVPLSSRAVVVHIYPLLAAGSEAVSPEDRSWVKERWAAMVSRMWIGNIERCWEVIAEVWDRRDRFDAQQAEYSMVSSDDLSVSGARKRKFEMMDDSAEGEMYSEKRLGLTLGDTERSTVASYSLGEMKERIPFERTVRGSIHWAGVMREWGWEGELLITSHQLEMFELTSGKHSFTRMMMGDYEYVGACLKKRYIYISLSISIHT